MDILTQMNWADWLVVAVIVVSALLSLRRGFVKEALSLVTWVAAFIVARVFTDNLSVLLADYIDTPSARVIAAFVILFVVTLIVGALINRLISLIIEATGLSSTDRLLGMVFGIARGGLLVVVIVALLGMTPVIQDRWWQESALIPHFALMEGWTRNLASDASDVIMSIGH